MRLSIIINFCLYFLLCHRMSFSRNSPSAKNHKLSNPLVFNDILEKFFVHFEETYLRKRGPRHITIVEAADNDLEQVKPLFKNHPYIICNNSAKCEYNEQFSRGSFVVIFLYGLTEEAFEKNADIISRCRKCRILFISGGIILGQDISLIFTRATNQTVPYVRLAHIGINGIELYRNFITANCSMEVRLVTVWRPGVHLDKINTWAFQLDNLNGCPIPVSSLTFRPKMMIKEKDNGTLTIAGGREGKLLMAIAEKLNFTIALSYPSLVDRVKHSRKMSIINDVISETAEIGIGRIRPTNRLREVVTLSVAYDEECVTWGVPRIINWSNDIVGIEFSWKTWLIIGLIFAGTCALGYVQQNVLNISKSGRKQRLGLVTVVLDVFSGHLGNPVVYLPASGGRRLMLIAYLCYAMVVTTAYKTSLAAILATNKGTSMITDQETIINQNLIVGGSLYDYQILKDQANESEITSKFLMRFVVNNNDTECLYNLKYKHNYAFLARLSSLNYHLQNFVKAKELITFDTLDGCVLSYPTMVALNKKSLLRTPVNKIIRRLSESGILKFWDLNDVDDRQLAERRKAQKYYENRSTYKFHNMFIIYSGCIALCLIIFFIELLAPRLIKRNFRSG